MDWDRHVRSAAAAVAVVGAALTFQVSEASAATVTFTDWTSTNSSQLNPTLTVSEIAGGFEVSTELLAPEFGTLVALFFDFGTGLTNSALAGLSAVSVSPATPVGGLFSYTFKTGIGSTPEGAACGNDGNLNGLLLPAFEGVVCYKSTGPTWPTRDINPVTLQILDPDSILTLASFEGVGLRFKESSNAGGSDKLFSASPDVAAVPLPAGGLLLVAALGGLGLVARRRNAG